MKILITTDLFTTDTNGVVTSVRNLCDELKKKGHDVRILTLSDSSHSHKEGDVSYIRSASIGMIYPNVRMPLSYHHALIKELIRWKPDIIHSQCEMFSYQFALYVSKHTGAPIVHTYHTLYEQYIGYVIPGKKLGARLVRSLSRLRLKKAKKVIVPTHKVEDALIGYGLQNPISVVPSGISLEQHQKRISEATRLQMRKQLGIGAHQTVLLNLGRLGTEKNLGELVQYFSKALRKDKDLFFVIVGDGPARKELEAQAKELGVEKHVIFTGMVPPARVQDYYQIGDIFVSASTSETQGLTYVEAAANGLPLLCREDLCLKGVVIDGENGYQYRTEEDFLNRLTQMRSDPAWMAQAIKRSEEIAKGFDKSAFGDAAEQVYLSVIHPDTEL